MKNKKTIMIIGIVILVLLLVCYYYLMIFKDKRVKLSVHEAGNFTEYTGELPKFTIRFNGIASGGVDKETLDVNEVKPYEFYAVIEDNGNISTNKYIGYKMTDFLSILKDQNYNAIRAYNVNGLKITYSLDLINSDSLFIVFYKDDEKIFNKKISLISVKEDSQYYIDNLVGIELLGVEAK